MAPSRRHCPGGILNGLPFSNKPATTNLPLLARPFGAIEQIEILFLGALSMANQTLWR